MAEAHNIALVGLELKRGAELSVDEEGLHVELRFTIPPPKVLRRVFWVRLNRMQSWLINTFFPLGPAALGVLLAVFLYVVLSADDRSWWRSGPLATFVWDVASMFPWHEGIGRYPKIAIMTFWAVVVGFFLLVLLHRAMLRALLAYRGWMYAPRGRTPLPVKLWGLAVKVRRAAGGARNLSADLGHPLPALAPPPPPAPCARRCLAAAAR